MKLNSKKLFLFFLFIILAIYVVFVVSSISANLPKEGRNPVFYSNQMRQDLKVTCIHALKNAKKSIHLVMFGLTDENILSLLKKKSLENISLKVFTDKTTTNQIEIKPDQLFKIRSRGLMHQKILVIDNSIVFIGSANMTTSSLRMHDNLIIGFFSSQIADFLSQKSPLSPGFITSYVGDQKIDVWLLPDSQDKAINRLRELIGSAKSSIEVAMFTFTHPALTESLIEAKKRGLNVKVAIDFQSKNGASKKAIENLKNNNIEIYFNQDSKLCHHKYILLDNNTFVCGSANWTKAAFKNNYDCFVILYNLDGSQKKFMKRLWQIIQGDSALLK
ncbi:MAG: phospholipase D-like domain-containing protein [Parachlamydiales bacterium]